MMRILVIVSILTIPVKLHFTQNVKIYDESNPLLIKDELIKTNQPENMHSNNLRDYTIIVITFLIFLIISSTFYDFYVDEQERSLLLTTFSLKRNLPWLLEEKAHGCSIECIDGIRVLTVFWIVILHVFSEILCVFVKTIYNPHDAVNFSKSIWYLVAQQGQMGVDTCFLLSGICLTYNFMHKYSNKSWKSFNLLEHYSHRYLRLTPSYAAAIIFYTLVYELPAGPVFYKMNINSGGSCRGNWIKILSYIDISDYFESCLPQGWSIDIDMKLFYLSPLILLPLMEFRYKFLPLIYAVIALTIYYAYRIVVEHGITFDQMKSMDVNTMRLIYYPGYIRSGPWFIGIITGYLLFEHRNGKKQMSKIVLTTFWTISTTLILLIVVPLNQPSGVHGSTLFSSIFIPSYRLIWSFSIAWIVYACQNNYGVSLNWFLSRPLWNIGAKLGYSIILTHYTLIVLICKQFEIPFVFNEIHLCIMSIGILLLSLIIAIPWSLMFEIPFRNLERDLWKLWRSKRKPNKQV